MPSLAASVASRMRTGSRSGAAWKAAFRCSRFVRVHTAVEEAQAISAEASSTKKPGQPRSGCPRTR